MKGNGEEKEKWERDGEGDRMRNERRGEICVRFFFWFEGGEKEKRRVRRGEEGPLRDRSLPKILGDKSEGVGWIAHVSPLVNTSTYQMFRYNVRGGRGNKYFF